MFLSSTTTYLGTKICLNSKVISGQQIYRDMENEILKYLTKKPSLDEIYGTIPTDDIIDKRITDFIKEES